MPNHRSWMNYPMLSVPFDDDQARDYLVREENVRCATVAQRREEIRAKLASEIGIAPGTIENIRRNRFVSLRTVVRDRIQAWMIRGLQEKIRNLENELQMALQCGEGPTSDVVLGAKAALAKAHEALNDRGGVS